MIGQYLPMIIFGVTLNAAAQLLLKKGMTIIGEFSFNWSGITTVGWSVMTNFFVIGGLSCYIMSVLIWLGILSRIEVTAAYPLLSIGYIVTAVAGYLFFGETLSVIRILGIGVIIVGVYLVSKS